MRDDLINRWPVIRAFCWGAFLAGLTGVMAFVGVQQRHQHTANRQAIRAVDIAWEICRAAQGNPAQHDKGGGWIRTAGLTSEQLEKAATTAGEWAWTDAVGHFTEWPGHEDDASNDEDDVCGEAWRAGYDAAVPQD